MFFTLVDVILIVAVAGFVMLGFFMGLISVIGSLFGIVFGTWAASSYFMPVADFISPYILGHDGLAKTLAFLAIFFIVNRAVSLIFWLINKSFNLVSIIPFLKSINRLAGAILGLFEGVVIIGLAVFIMSKFITNVSWISQSLNNSKIAHLLVLITQFLSNFIP
ncbi:MAG: CvpA family protein [Candidatus Buchananbacteria bacterium]|nr:CvpA family protein [Candidatus Buchananbacteria bacterium]